MLVHSLQIKMYLILLLHLPALFVMPNEDCWPHKAFLTAVFLWFSSAIIGLKKLLRVYFLFLFQQQDKWQFFSLGKIWQSIQQSTVIYEKWNCMFDVQHIVPNMSAQHVRTLSSIGWCGKCSTQTMSTSLRRESLLIRHTLPYQTQTHLSNPNPPHQTQSLQTGPGPSHWAVLSTRPTARSGWPSPSETVTSWVSMQQHTINPRHGIHVHHTNMASSVKWNKCKILKPSPLLHWHQADIHLVEWSTLAKCQKCPDTTELPG